MNDEIKRAVETRDFFKVCQKTAIDYKQLCALYGNGEPPDFTRADVAQAASDAGLTKEFERDCALGELAVSSRLSIAKYAGDGGKHVHTNDDCELFIERNTGKDNAYDQKVSSPLMVVGEGHNNADGAACLQVLVKTTKGTWTEVFLPRGELVNGGQTQARLQSVGLRPGAYDVLLHMFQNIDPRRKFKRLEHAGWTGEYYALPSGEVIPNDDLAIATFAPVPNFEIGGDKDHADALLTAMEGNSRLLFATAAALSAPIQAHYGPDAEPGGYHFYGSSSRGKTTVLSAAGSVWGRGAEKKDGGIVDSWNTTTFAAEHTASQHSDCVMIFDEVRAANPEQFASLALGIANGAGKKAGRSDGGLRESKVFRPTLLSTGEISSKDYIESNGLAYHGGMSVRIVDVPAEPANGSGVFETVPDQFNGDGGAFAVWIKKQSATHFGHHGRELVQKFLGDREGFLTDVRDAARGIAADLTGSDEASIDGQTGRVRDRIAFVAGVAIAAARRGIVPWAEQAIKHAVAAVFSDWYAQRGGHGAQEGLAAEKAFSAFIYANPGRFDFDGLRADRNRLGIITRTDDLRREYWIASDIGLAEMLGNQPERIGPFIKHLKDGLSEAWELVPGSGNRSKRDAPKGRNMPKRAYCIRAKDVGDELNGAANDDQPGVAKAPMPASRFEAAE